MTGKGLRIKICGMREFQNMEEVAALRPDFMGFIFYSKSPRFVETLDVGATSYLKKQNIQPVAVLVNEPVEAIFERVEKGGFSWVQLHGRETPDHCAALKSKGLFVMKAFSIAEASDFEETRFYHGVCDYFLFDTKTVLHGGSGQRFDWSVLRNYTGTTPFFLSGGIGPEDAVQVNCLDHPLLAGVDLNSRFEDRPAFKNAALLQTFIHQLK